MSTANVIAVAGIAATIGATVVGGLLSIVISQMRGSIDDVGKRVGNIEKALIDNAIAKI